jgi:hypothetical protein
MRAAPVRGRPLSAASDGRTAEHPDMPQTEPVAPPHKPRERPMPSPQEPAPGPQTPPRQPRRELDPFNPDWPDTRPTPEPKAGFERG